MDAASVIMLSRSGTLRALGATPLRLRARATDAAVDTAALHPAPAASPGAAPPLHFDNRIALARSSQELHQPALAELSARITEAISKLGLQCVRMIDAERDTAVRVLAFGDAPVAATIDPARVLRVDTLSTLHADRERKRALWDLLQGLAREAGSY